MMYFPLSNGVSNGVVNYIKNSKLQSLIKITSSGQYYDYRPASELAKENIFYTERNSNYGQVILFEFTKHYIDFEGYSLMARQINEYPSYWRIEVSPDGFCWGVTSTKSGENTSGNGKSFSTSLIKGIKYIRMIQTGHGGQASSTNEFIL